jgi:hypothetical protein
MWVTDSELELGTLAGEENDAPTDYVSPQPPACHLFAILPSQPPRTMLVTGGQRARNAHKTRGSATG